MASGPCGGVAGAVRTGGKGQRRMMTRGIKLGSYVRLMYRLPGKMSISQEEDMHDYEGKLVNKRIGAEDRESYVELKDCLKFSLEGKFLGAEKTRRFIDAFIDKCEVCEKRDPQPQLDETTPAVGSTAVAAAADADDEDDDDDDDDDHHHGGEHHIQMMPGMMPGLPTMMPGMPMPMMMPGMQMAMPMMSMPMMMPMNAMMLQGMPNTSGGMLGCGACGACSNFGGCGPCAFPCGSLCGSPSSSPCVMSHVPGVPSNSVRDRSRSRQRTV
eukprot:TRINITY_DN94157_c0_g1_i1.p1 TRINITY_DN94157_c0_g1~~TRINITY_DN94157_c0_g1_i1.p1  ORF type:complete len:270 (-),score=62.28 TRINITY_DN94157_c0_g1_i1:24-833(-)